jgi:hypothetical protein
MLRTPRAGKQACPEVRHCPPQKASRHLTRNPTFWFTVPSSFGRLLAAWPRLGPVGRAGPVLAGHLRSGVRETSEAQPTSHRTLTPV